MSESGTRQVTTWSLEQTAPEDLLDAPASGPGPADGPAGGPAGGPDPSDGLRIVRAEVPSAGFSGFLYREVGADVEWTERLPWTRQRWTEWLERPGVETWVAYQRGTPAGFIELDGATVDTSGRGAPPGATVEISYFGLLPGFRGMGIGRRLLAVGTRRAWELAERWSGRPPTARVWLHTCTKDGPHALRNYRRRGFRVFAEEVTLEPAPVPAPRTAAESAEQSTGPGASGASGSRPAPM